MERGKLILFTGPSGAGKGTVEEYFINDESLNLYFSISATTRQPREGEVHGEHYYFMSKEEFEQHIAEEKFVEWAEYVDNLYGTLISELENNLASGKNVFIEIEMVGAKNILRLFPDCISIFLSPPSIEELRNRLVKRGSEPEEIINKRIETAKKEMADKHLFKYTVINDDEKRAANEIKEIVLKEYNK